MHSLHFVYQTQFDAELGEIEPCSVYQVALCELVERACGSRTKMGALGPCVARVSWTPALMTWFWTDGTTVYLESIKYDLFTPSGTV